MKTLTALLLFLGISSLGFGQDKVVEAAPGVERPDSCWIKHTEEVMKKWDPNAILRWNYQDDYAATTLTDGDTLEVHKAGSCRIFYDANLHTSIPFENVELLIDKCHWLATTFFSDSFDTEYNRLITQNLHKLVYSDSKFKHYRMSGSSLPANYILLGFTITKTARGSLISISAYIRE